MVSRIKRYYSRREEALLLHIILMIYRVVANFLTTSPAAYTYYLMILGGVVWNSLGSGWVGPAFQDYSRSFGICYLVCVILSWISTIISPTFVLSGRILCYG